MFVSKKHRRGITLVELMSVTTMMLVIAGFVSDIVKAGHSGLALTECASNLRQTGIAFNMYREDYYMLPEFYPPLGLGDLHNWSDLYSFSDPGGDYFSSLTISPGNIRLGNMTADPRVPRLLEEYAGDNDVALLCCPSQGASAFWKDLGPFYYNTSNPFFFGATKKWQPLARKNPKQPLAACQNPQFLLNFSDRSWRHGKRRRAEGTNNHLYRDGSVKEVCNPHSWTSQ